MIFIGKRVKINSQFRDSIFIFIVSLVFCNERRMIVKILILRTTPNKMTLKNYNLQEIGLAKALIRKGHQCDVGYYCGKEKDHIQEISFDENRVLKVLWLHGFGTLYEGVYPSLGKYIKNYDIIQVGGYVGLTSCWLNIFAKDKTVNYNGLYYCEDNAGDIKKARVFDKTLLKLQDKKNMVVATKSVLATNYLKSKGIENVFTVGVGLDLDNLTRNTADIQNNEFADAIRNSVFSKKLLYIGVLEERRNIPFLLETFKKTSEKLPGVGLVLIGKGKAEYVSMCMRKIEELGIKDKVIYRESLEQKYMPAVYQACDAFLLPTRYEIFGMVLLEAMYYGLPVFTTYNGGSSTLMNEENGIIVNSFDINMWSEKIVEILADEKKSKIIGTVAHQTIAENYTWDALADKFLKVYFMRINGHLN